MRNTLLNGIRVKTSGNSVIFVVDALTDEIKDEIRTRLVEICYGTSGASSTRKVYSYKATVKEFIKRYKDSPDSSSNRNKGMIGELLFHIIWGGDKDYVPVSAFFNLEERSFKKGFDAAYYSPISNELWIAEVKSGEKQKTQISPSTTAVNLINRAKLDLGDRLKSENSSIWVNAINHARIAMKETSDEKAAVMSLLGQYSDDAEEGRYISVDKNVILVGVLFHSPEDEVDIDIIKNKQESIEKERLFRAQIAVVIQKSTYEAVFRFLESEASDGE